MKVVGFLTHEIPLAGGNVVIYDYALGNQSILKNKSIVLVRYIHPLAYNKLSADLDVRVYESEEQLHDIVEQEKIDITYQLTDGISFIQTKALNAVHAVFHAKQPIGDRFAAVSEWLAKNQECNQWVPHIVSPEIKTKNMRWSLQIPTDAIVFGRHGSYTTFDIPFVWSAIKRAVHNNPNIYFIFLNTKPFYQHKQIIHLDGTPDLRIKAQFIQTCNAMIHARQRGETFGLSPAEFSAYNKPVYSYFQSPERAHIEMLGDKGVYYSSEEELVALFSAHQKDYAERDWNAYRNYTSEIVMQKFKSVFLDG